jgi:cytoskeletal protein CcmA (bactofilin family)
MTEVQILRNRDRVELGTVQGDVEIRDCRLIVPQQGEQITVTGTIRVRGDTVIEGSLKAYSLRTEHCDIEIQGDLVVETTVTIDKGSIEVKGSASAKQIQADATIGIGGDLICGSGKAGGAIRVSKNAKAMRLSAGGSVAVNGDAEVERLDAGGSVSVGGRVEAKEMAAGGSGRCNSGKISRVSIGGSFKAEGAVEVDEIDVGGAVSVGPGSKVGSVDVGGAFKASGDLTFGKIDVGGAVKIEGSAQGALIDVGGAVHVQGSLTITEKLDVGGTAVVDQDLRCSSTIDVGGTLTAGGRIDSMSIDVGGRIEAKYIRAEETFRIGKRGEVRGFVESKDIVIRERARVESLYGDQIRVEERARVKSIYGRSVYLEREVVVEGEVLYTDSFEAEERVVLKTEPRKVDQLPPPESTQ